MPVNFRDASHTYNIHSNDNPPYQSMNCMKNYRFDYNKLIRQAKRTLSNNPVITSLKADNYFYNQQSSQPLNP